MDGKNPKDPSLRSKCLGTWRRWFGFSVHSAVVYQRIRLQPQQLKQHLTLSLGRDWGCHCITLFLSWNWNRHTFYGLMVIFTSVSSGWFRLVVRGEFSPHTLIQIFFLFVQIQNIYFDYSSSHHRNAAFLMDYLFYYISFGRQIPLLRRITTLDSPRFQPSYHRFISSIRLFHHGKLYCGLRSIADLMRAIFLFDKLVENKLLFLGGSLNHFFKFHPTNLGKIPIFNNIF